MRKIIKFSLCIPFFSSLQITSNNCSFTLFWFVFFYLLVIKKSNEMGKLKKEKCLAQSIKQCTTQWVIMKEETRRNSDKDIWNWKEEKWGNKTKNILFITSSMVCHKTLDKLFSFAYPFLFLPYSFSFVIWKSYIRKKKSIPSVENRTCKN